MKKKVQFHLHLFRKDFILLDYPVSYSGDPGFDSRSLRPAISIEIFVVFLSHN
jgi:hypothetical protein